MKFSSKILALCALHPNVWGTDAFVLQVPKALSLKGHTSSSAAYLGRTSEEASSTFSYLSGERSDTFTGTNGAISGANGAVSAKGASTNPKSTLGSSPEKVKNIWETATPVTVQGGSLRTWSFTTPSIERVQVLLKSEGRPVNANIELWQGPDNSPQKMMVYIEDGSVRPFSAVIETPRGHNAIAIRNTGQMEFPLIAGVVADVGNGSTGLGAVTKSLSEKGASKTVQGGAVQTYPFGSNVASVQLLLKTDGRPLNARIELLQGPNNNKQVIEIYTEDGRERPFFAVIDTPGSGNVIRIVNTAPVEFPMTASVEPYLIDPGTKSSAIDGEDTGYFVLDRQW